MMIEILHYIPVLGVAILINIVLGLYNSLGTLDLKFDWKKLVGGVLKALAIGAAFIGLAYCFDATGTTIDFTVFEINPSTIMTSSIILYVGKGLINLASILGVYQKKGDTIENETTGN